MGTAQELSSDPARVETQTKERTREIVRAYRHSWDIYSELIQNAVDAINRRYRILNDPDFQLYHEFRSAFPDLKSDPSYRGVVDITVDVPNREITVRDNGVGIASDKIEKFLLPEGSDKVYAGAGDDAVGHSYGNDYIEGGPGSDTLRGGFGLDVIYDDKAGSPGDGVYDLLDCAYLTSRGDSGKDEGNGEATDTVVNCSNRDDQ